MMMWNKNKKIKEMNLKKNDDNKSLNAEPEERPVLVLYRAKSLEEWVPLQKECKVSTTFHVYIYLHNFTCFTYKTIINNKTSYDLIVDFTRYGLLAHGPDQKTSPQQSSPNLIANRRLQLWTEEVTVLGLEK